jgi:hypothetical protein
MTSKREMKKERKTMMRNERKEHKADLRNKPAMAVSNEE